MISTGILKSNINSKAVWLQRYWDTFWLSHFHKNQQMAHNTMCKKTVVVTLHLSTEALSFKAFNHIGHWVYHPNSINAASLRRMCVWECHHYLFLSICCCESLKRNWKTHRLCVFGGLHIMRDSLWWAMHQNTFKGVNIMKYYDRECTEDRLWAQILNSSQNKCYERTANRL